MLELADRAAEVVVGHARHIVADAPPALAALLRCPVEGIELHRLAVILKRQGRAVQSCAMEAVGRLFYSRRVRLECNFAVLGGEAGSGRGAGEEGRRRIRGAAVRPVRQVGSAVEAVGISSQAPVHVHERRNRTREAVVIVAVGPPPGSPRSSFTIVGWAAAERSNRRAIGTDATPIE